MASSSAPVILIIDDSFDHQELLRILLEGEGFQVAAAFNGREALDMMEKMPAPPALILLDLMMPVMDGFAFRALQLSTSGLAKIPVVVMSASGQAEEQLKDMRAAGFLKKPMDIEELLRLAAKLTRPETASPQTRSSLVAAAEAQETLREIKDADGAEAQRNK